MKSFVGRSVFLFQSWDHHFEMLESTVALGMLPIITTLKSSRVPSRCSRLLQWNTPCAHASASAKLIYHRENKRSRTSIALSDGVSHIYDERGRSQITDRFWSEFTHTPGLCHPSNKYENLQIHTRILRKNTIMEECSTSIITVLKLPEQPWDDLRHPRTSVPTCTRTG